MNYLLPTAFPAPSRRYAYALLLISLFFNETAAAQNHYTDSLRHSMHHHADRDSRLNAAKKYIEFLYNKQEYDSSLYYCQYFKPLAEQGRHIGMLRLIHHIKSSFYSKNGQFDSAAIEIRQAQKLAVAANDTVMITDNLALLAFLFSRQSNLPELKQVLSMAQVFQDNPHPVVQMNIAKCLVQTGIGFNEMKQLDSAEYYMQAAIKQAGSILKENLVIYQARYLLGSILTNKKNYAAAKPLIDSSLAYFRKNNIKAGVAFCLGVLGRIAKASDKPAIAIAHFREAIAMMIPMKDTKGLEELHTDLAGAYGHAGNWEQAYRTLTIANIYRDSIETINNKNALSDLKTNQEKLLREKENEVLSLQLANRKAVIERQRWIIGSVVLLALLLSVTLLFYFRYRRHRWQQAAELRQVDNELRSLKSQLDPHLIHNFFRFLTRQVREGAQEKTVYLLSECSRYFRNILDQNRKSIISLEEELDGLKRYLQIQQKIQNDKFQYSIHADDNVDLYGIELPAFLFQPFIENSLKHGFSDIDYTGRLDIHFTATDQYLEGIITDNGTHNSTVAAEAPNQPSVGLQLTTERLNLYTRLKKRKQGFIESGSRTDGRGYFVRVKIPLI
jgi:Histidine kinase